MCYGVELIKEGENQIKVKGKKKEKKNKRSLKFFKEPRGRRDAVDEMTGTAS